VSAFVLILTFILAQAPQNQQSQDAASLEGFVVKLATTDPVARVKVVLTKEGMPPSSMSATTEGDGKFVFHGIQPGRYRLTATRDGYVRGEHGQRGPNLPGTPITFAPRQEMKDVRIALTPTGALAGRVFDRYGDPVGNASVQALRYSYQDGRRVLTVVQSARTNDLGEYRLFWMQPGQYIVSAVPSDNRLDGMTIDIGAGAPVQVATMISGIRVGGGISPGPAGPDTNETYLTVYYPGTTDAAAASSIELRPGANYPGVDLTVADTRAVRVKGRVVSNRPGPLGGSVTLIPRGTVTGGMAGQRSAGVSDQGTFEFRGVAPGAYDVVATSGRQMFTYSESSSTGPGGQSVTRNAFIVTAPTGAAPIELPRALNQTNAEPRLFGRVSLDVGSADVENVTISLQQGFTLSGRINIDGSSMNPDALQNMRVMLRPDPMIPQLMFAPATVNANGTFTVTDVVPGEYRISVSSMPRGGFVKTASLGGTDASNLFLRLDGEPRAQLDILVGTNPGTLDATVQNEKQEAVPGVTVVLVPDGPRRQRSELYRMVTADAAGRIHLDNVVPGTYKLFAWESVENGVWQDPEFMRLHEDRGRPVRIAEGSREIADVRVIPYR